MSVKSYIARESDGTQGHAVSYYFDIASGTYAFILLGSMGPDHGIIHWDLTRDDGYAIGEIATTDMYAAAESWSNPASTGGGWAGLPTFTPADETEWGRYILTLSMDSKNASATGYLGRLQSLWCQLEIAGAGATVYAPNDIIDPFTNPVYDNQWGGAVSVDLETLARRVRTVTSTPYALDADTDDVVLVDVSGGATVNIPSATDLAGRTFDIKRLNAPPGNVTIAPASGTIDGASSYVLTARYMSARLLSDGTNWHLI